MTDERRILVTGAGGPAGVTVVRTLRQLGVWVLATDVNRYGAGLQLADDAETVPPYTDPDYVTALIETAGRHDVNGLISTMTEGMSVLTAPESEPRFGEHGIATWFPPKAAVDACLDKARFAEVTEGAGQPVPRSAWGPVEDALARVPGPWIVKPRFGRGSRDIYSTDDADVVREVWPRVPEPILQTRISGREFTFDALVDRDGSLAGGVPRFRVETKSGISTTGVTFAAPGIHEAVESFLGCLGHTGPANVQGFIGDGGELTFMEVNPRFSGALALSLGSGADLVGQYVNAVYGQPIDRAALTYEPGTVMTRYWAESFTHEDPLELPPLVPYVPGV
ncbi:MAG: ATP-grasp domain-containing protein [Actinobacteria bacterium]|nr:ATP-grasp domain-containing protein [Actinomycetota bacterium]MCB9411853.1 ATP-grasp domain-containing protein [Actinomycetota bacterium]